MQSKKALEQGDDCSTEDEDTADHKAARNNKIRTARERMEALPYPASETDLFSSIKSK